MKTRQEGAYFVCDSRPWFENFGIDEGEDMNKYQRIATLCGIIVVFLMLLFPPYNLRTPYGITLNMGYAFIFSPPETTYAGSINGALLLVQWIGVLIMTGLGYLLLSKKE